MSTRTLVRFVVGAIACGTTVIAWSQAAVVPSGGATNVDWPVYRGDQKGNQVLSAGTHSRGQRP